MSGFVFPSNILGLGFGVTRSPKWTTGVQRATSGRMTAIAYQLYPFISFQLIYDLLRDDISVSDLKAVTGLFNAMQGRFDSFLFEDPDFNQVTAQQFGTSTGNTSTTYQLVATYQNSGGPGYSEIVQNLNGTPTLYANGAVISSSTYTVGATGVVTFSTSPAANDTLTWSGKFYYRCRFDEDEVEFSKFMNQWWTTKLKFTSIIL